MNKLSTLALAVLALAAAPAMAGTATGTMNVSLTVTKMCTAVTGTAMAFGNADYTQSGNIDKTSTITLTCTRNTAYNIGLDKGSAPGATVSGRLMTGTGGNTDTVGYALYRDSGRSQNWGNTLGAGGDTLGGTGSGASQNVTVYGRVTPAALQNVAADSYSDTVNITVTY